MACICVKPEAQLDQSRHPNSCVKCGRRIVGKHVVGDEQVEEFFNLLGRYMPANESRANQTSPIPDFEAFRTHCELRERWGRHHFGFAYLQRDNQAEGMEEAADGALYSMLGTYAMWRTGYDPDVAASMLDAAHHFALAHAALRRAQQQRRGTPFSLTESGDE